MSKVLDRYASAVHSSNLKSDPRTSYSDSDVLGAAGLAGKNKPLAMALARLFSGDNTAAHELVRIMAELVWNKRRHFGAEDFRRRTAEDMARAVLAWHRDGACRPCGGHGFELIPGTRTVGGTSCRACKGTAKVPFDKQFPLERLGMARWLLNEVEKELADAGSAAMAKLAPKLELL